MKQDKMSVVRFFVMACLLVLAVSHGAYALQSDAVRNDYSTARLVVDRDHITAGEPFWIALHLDMKKGWHTYWQNPGDSGIPTEIKLDLPEGFSTSEIHWPTPIRFELSGIVNYGYKEEAYHFIEVTPPAQLDEDITLTAKTSWLICEEICVPEYADFTMTLPVNAIPANVDIDIYNQLQKVPQISERTASFNHLGSKTLLQLPYGGTFYPLDNDIVSNEVLPEVIKTDAGAQLLFHSGSQRQDSLRGVLVGDGASVEITATLDPALTFPENTTPQLPKNSGEPKLSFVAALFFAFVGGLILNLMPCVLPVLSLKALGLVKLSEESRGVAIMHGIAYTVGISLCFIVIAVVLILLQQGGAQIGWGFQLQSPVFVAGLALLMLLVGLNLSGMYELPLLFGNIGQSASAQQSPMGSFFTGVLAVLVATPCTAPLMAPAIGYALTQPPALQILIFVSLGLGLAAPFLLISLLPQLGRLLPKPGAWMLRFKQFLAFPMYATAAWLVWVLTKQAGADALASILTAALAIAFVLWRMQGKMGKADRVVLPLVMIAVISLSLHHIANLKNAEMLGQRTEIFSQERLDELRADGQTVFVYATADWCITCKINERVALNTETVAMHFDKRGIMVLKADWTDHSDHITQFLRSHDRAGVPLYVYYAPNEAPALLPQLLTPSLVVNATQP